MILPRTPDEPLVVDVARGLDRGSMIEQAHRVFMQAAYCVGYHGEKGNVKGFVWSCVFAILSGGLLLQDLTPKWAADLGVRVRPSWCLLFVLIRQGLRGGSGPQRWIRALGEETGNPIMAFHRPSFFPSVERAPHHTTTENPLLGGDPSP